jgi:hypothetical protein
MHCLQRYRQQRTDDHAKPPDSETAESIIVPKWLFPPRFPDKDRFTSSCPDFVLVTPIAAKTQKQQTNVGSAWVLRSGRRQLRERLGAPQHHRQPPVEPQNPDSNDLSKDLSKPRRDIHVVEIKYCEDTRPQNQLNAAKEQQPQRSLQHSHCQKASRYQRVSELQKRVSEPEA